MAGIKTVYILSAVDPSLLSTAKATLLLPFLKGAATVSTAFSRASPIIEAHGPNPLAAGRAHYHRLPAQDVSWYDARHAEVFDQIRTRSPGGACANAQQTDEQRVGALASRRYRPVRILTDVPLSSDAPGRHLLFLRDYSLADARLRDHDPGVPGDPRSAPAHESLIPSTSS